MEIFTTLSVVINDILSMAIIPTLSTSILFCNFLLYTIVNFTTQCGENPHTDTANLATLIHTKKISTLCGDFYHIVW